MNTWRASTTGFSGAAGFTPAAGLTGDPAVGAAPTSEEAQYLDACVAEVEAWLGPELTAYLAGAESPADLAGWISDGAPPGGDDGSQPDEPDEADQPPTEGPTSISAAGRRLRTASEVVEIFAAAGHGTQARAWLREVSPRTGMRQPANLVRYARDEALLDDVRDAAEDHLRHDHGGSVGAAA